MGTVASSTVHNCISSRVRQETVLGLDLTRYFNHDLINLLDKTRILHHNLASLWKGVSRLTDLVEFALTIRAQDHGGTLVALAGELDLHRVPALADALQAASGRVVVDLQEVTFLDSATLALLVHEHGRLQAAGRELTVLVGERTPTTVFALTGIDRILTIRSAELPSEVADSRAA